MTKYHIRCEHPVDSKERYPDYHPLTRSEFDHLIALVGSSGMDISSEASIQVRLGQAIRGTTCPHEIDGLVARKHAELNVAFVNFCEGQETAEALWEIIAAS